MGGFYYSFIFLYSLFFCPSSPRKGKIQAKTRAALKQCHPERSGAAAQSKDLHWKSPAEVFKSESVALA
jgi:hypothetical protein